MGRTIANGLGSVNLANLQDFPLQANHLAHRIRLAGSRVDAVEGGPRPAQIEVAAGDASNFALTTGREDLAGVNDRTVYTCVYTRRLGAMTYVMEHLFGSEANAEFDTNFQPDSGKWYSINQYFFTDVSPKLTTGMRIEWFRDQDNARVLQLPFESSTNGGNYVGLTLGMNWRPTCNMIVRPELRYDYSDVEAFGQRVFDDFTKRDQLTLAIDAIFRF